MSEPILSHTLANGLVLVAEPMPWLQSVAFTCWCRPAVPTTRRSRRPQRIPLRDVLRGAGPRDSRQLVQDLDNLGVERNDSVSEPIRGSAGPLAENLPQALTIFANVVLRPHLPAGQLEADAASDDPGVAGRGR